MLLTKTTKQAFPNMTKQATLWGSIIIVSVFLLAACGGREYIKPPLDTLIQEFDSLKDFTVILYDMDIDGRKYKHRYKVITDDAEGNPKEEIKDWAFVDEATFDRYENDLGMEVASKDDGKLSKQTAPPGYSRYVGNERYGNWQSRSDGSSFWQFYGQYAFMSSMLGLAYRPVYRNTWSDYRTNYRGTRPYYGGTTAAGRPMYGTFSDVSRQQSPSFHSRPTTSNFQQRVSSRASRSTGSSSTAGSRSGSRSTSSSSRSRSSSRGGK